MDAVELPDFVEFEEGQVIRKTVFESANLFVQTICLDQRGTWGPVTDPDSDAVVTIVAGEAVFMLNRKRKRLTQWGAVMVPASSELLITNASPEPLVVLMVVAPPPRPAAVNG